MDDEQKGYARRGMISEFESWGWKLKLLGAVLVAIGIASIVQAALS